MEAIPLKVASSANVIEFVQEHIIYRFGVPQSFTTDQGKMFTSKDFDDFAASIAYKLINSSSYYAQANGQVEASNQILIKIIKKKIRENPRKWHSILSETLWSYRMACHGSTKCSPYELVYAHQVVLPWECMINFWYIIFPVPSNTGCQQGVTRAIFFRHGSNILSHITNKHML